MAQDAILLLQADHQTMKQLLADMTELLGAESPDTAAIIGKAADFNRVLARHEKREEQILFPAIKGMGPVQLVMQEHERLAPLRAKLNEALIAAQADPNGDHLKTLAHDVQQVAYCLSGHFMKEEQLAFRIAMATLGKEQLAEMGTAMEALD